MHKTQKTLTQSTTIYVYYFALFLPKQEKKAEQIKQMEWS